MSSSVDLTLNAKNQNRPFGRFWHRGLNSSKILAGGGRFYEDVGVILSRSLTKDNNVKILEA